VRKCTAPRCPKHHHMQIYSLDAIALPMALALPREGNRNFGTSPFYGQHSDRPPPSCNVTWEAERDAQEGVAKNSPHGHGSAA
jgi:hypothetical protein